MLIFAFVAVGAGALAVFATLAHGFLTGRNPSDDPARAFLAEFLGLWIAGFFLVSSFLIDDVVAAWILRLLFFFSAVAALYVRATIIHATTVPERPSPEQAAVVEISHDEISPDEIMPEQTSAEQPIVKSDTADLHSEEPVASNEPH